MKKSLKKFLVVSVITAIALAISSGDKTLLAQDALFDDPIVAKGKGFTVKRSELDDSFIGYKANAAAINERIPEEKRDLLEAELLNELVLTEILLQKATEADKTKAAASAKELIATVKGRASTETIFKLRLKALGLTPEAFEKQVLDQETRKAVLQREVGEKIEISDDAIQKFYDENPSEFEQKEKVRAAHILISTVEAGKPVSAEKKKEKEAAAKKIKERADKGEDFASLAKELSEDPGSRNRGGEYTFGRGEMVPAFEKAAFGMRQGQISDLVETQYGFHIIKLLEKIPAKKLTVIEAKPKIREFLAGKELAKSLPSYYDKLKQDYAVEILDEKLKAKMAEAREVSVGTLKER